VLLLTKLIELGLELKDDSAQNGLLSAFTNDIPGEVKNITGDLLSKAGLTDTCMGNVVFMGVAIKKGFETRLYSCDAYKIPFGQYNESCV